MTEKTKGPYHAFRVSTDAVRAECRNARAGKMAERLAPRAALARSLAADAVVHIPRAAGHALCPPGTLNGTREVVAFAQETVRSVDIEQRKQKANKPFMMKLLPSVSLTLESPLLSLGLRREIVASAAAYLGLVPILQYANVFFSSYTGADARKSQLFHCDSDETEQMKVFVLCDEVTPESGPLTFLPAAPSETLRGKAAYKYNTRLTDTKVRELLGAAAAPTAILGPAGTTAFLDTSRCFHFGSRCADASTHRLVVMLQYVTPLAFILPDDHREGAQFRHLVSDTHDEVTRLVLGAA